ncbi:MULTISPECIES: glutathione synthase [Chromohalobacter]|uniref:Glutathione synthetase n=1 Tax=Chromohalobacter moromii TaxID=2860329 RepID=A0A9X3AXQ4_9GAMM|nr:MULTISPECIES: glutathione synthase [Chromohalobacter]MBZ5876469.1 glutathione synthase [Chromohalobacter salexigens]MCK2043304.1 glutathione synthase [Chromohalobacter moromii]MCK2046035.1 glutathione synthase [Chromohalobacter moromii]MCT8505541.1 glutathione synthase [Chromohalobacter moromii]MCT8515460.1 glutathione synthase [Chromohalobacter sp. TMW 2.2271]
MSERALKLGVVMDPIADIAYKKDTTLAMLWAAQQRGWSLYYLEPEDLYLEGGRAMGRMRALEAYRDPEAWYRLEEVQAAPLAELDVILMRQDPPVDDHFLNAVHLLGFAEREGVLVVNPTQALLTSNEKLFAQQFPHCIPPSVVSCHDAVLRDFHARHGDVIFKPLDGMGGSGIFHITPEGRNLGSVIEQLTERGTRQIMAQRYLPEIKAGDTRILLIDGEPVPYGLARIPSAGETRGNLAAGGRGEARELTDRDYWLIEQVKPAILDKGLIFVGLDVIGDYITEINVTSPTCVREIDAQRGTDIGGLLMDAIARRF